MTTSIENEELQKKVILIDDDKDFTESLSDILELKGYKPIIANTVQTSIKLVKSLKPHVALIDLHIGTSNGLRLISKYKELNPKMICLIVTAHVEIESALEALKMGAYDYLRKPLSGEELIAAMERCFDLLSLEEQKKETELELVDRNKELEELNRRLRDVVDSSYRFNRFSDLNDLVVYMKEEFDKKLLVDKSEVFIVNEGVISKFFNEKNNDNILQLWNEDYENDEIVINCINGKFTYIQNLTNELRKYTTNLILEKYESILAMPFISKKGDINGFIVLYKIEPFGFNRYDIDVGLILSSLCSNSIKIQKAQEDLLHQEELTRQAQKMEAMGRLAGGVAHDFNNILAAIMGYSELLKMDFDSQSDISQKLDEIQKAVAHGSSLTQQLLTFSRRQNIKQQIIDINEVIIEMKRMLEVILGEKINLLLKTSHEPEYINGDIDQFKQVIINLAINSRDAMPGGGTLKIQTQRINISHFDLKKDPELKAGNYVCIQVIDSGVGMDEETLSHIFEPFYTTKSHGKGTGLGLATVFGIVKQCSGCIKVKSKLGKGVEFLIYFPITDAPVGSEKIVDLPKDFTALGCTIILAEDDMNIQKMTMEILKKWKINVLTANNGIEAFELYLKNKDNVDMVITDVMMPHMSGDILAEKLLDEDPHLNILFISGYSTESLFNNSKIKVNMENFLQKPFSSKELSKKIQLLLYDKLKI